MPRPGPVSLASLWIVLLPCSMRFDFIAPRAWGSWKEKLFSMVSRSKAGGEAMSAQAPADRQMGGKARILAGPWQWGGHAGWRMGPGL